MNSLCSLLALLGRIFLAIIFVLSGVSKFIEWDATAGYMASKGMTMVPFFLVSAAIVEVLMGIFLIIGFKTRFAATVLALFLIPTTLIFHDFWNLQGLDKTIQMIFFLKNLAIIGGLTYIIAFGAGCISVDSFCNRCCGKSQTPPTGTP